MENDYLRDAGIKTLGTRIRRLFERLNSNVTEVYRRELDFEQRWFALGMLLKDRGPMNSRDATKKLGQSHVAMVQVVRAMEKAGLLERKTDTNDARSKILHLTPTGAEKLEQVSAISRVVDQAAEALLMEAAPDFLKQLDALDDALDRLSFAERIETAFTDGDKDP
jgi:DNA-binding MarR family transcriptional regulator